MGQGCFMENLWNSLDSFDGNAYNKILAKAQL